MTLDSIRDLEVCFMQDGCGEGKWHVLSRSDSPITACGYDHSKSGWHVNHPRYGRRKLADLTAVQRFYDLCQRPACKNARRREVLAGW